MNVLGVLFDCKLNWNAHVASAICKAKKTLYALRLLRKFFNDQEMRLLLDSHFYSTLYYNSVLWLNPCLDSVTKQSILSVSANALRSCMMSNNNEISFDKIHKICKNVPPYRSYLINSRYIYISQLMQSLITVLQNMQLYLTILSALEGN